MRPLEVSPALYPLREHYPSADAVLRAVRGGDRDTRYALATLWLSEGIPYSFQQRPGVYEALRSWLARRLDLHAKEITLVGSGRQGFSLCPGPNLSRPFGNHSDLDLTVVRHSLFEQLKENFARWLADYTSGGVVPRHEQERKFWEANRESVPRGLARGFVDPHKIPTWTRYPVAQMIAQALYEAHEKLRATPEAPTVRKLSVRVYRDWGCFIRQMAVNLESATNRPA